MGKWPLAIVLLAVAGNIAWFGGLLRLIGEVIADIRPTIPSYSFNPAAWLVIGATFGVLAVVGVHVWPWYWRMLRQSAGDVYALNGKRRDSTPSFRASLRRLAPSLAAVSCGALLVALVLPGRLGRPSRSSSVSYSACPYRLLQRLWKPGARRPNRRQRRTESMPPRTPQPG